MVEHPETGGPGLNIRICENRLAQKYLSHPCRFTSLDSAWRAGSRHASGL